MPASQRHNLRIVGIQSGTGAIELGLSTSDSALVLLVEPDAFAKAVLNRHFPSVPIVRDLPDLKGLPAYDVLCAKVPKEPPLIAEILQSIAAARRKPRWIILVLTPLTFQVFAGRTVSFISKQLSSLGYGWAYRTIDARSFGLPHRHQRVILVASRGEDPGRVLFGDNRADDNNDEPTASNDATSYGFYWTEGRKGLGWSPDCTPPLKAAAGARFPSAPAVWVPATRAIGTIDIRDAERIQGLPADWTAVGSSPEDGMGHRWRLVGGLCCARFTAWVGKRIAKPRAWDRNRIGEEISLRGPWPAAAICEGNDRRSVNVSAWPLSTRLVPLLKFLRYPLCPLSRRATAGFLRRTKLSKRPFADGFIADVEHHLASHTE